MKYLEAAQTQVITRTQNEKTQFGRKPIWREDGSHQSSCGKLLLTQQAMIDSKAAAGQSAAMWQVLNRISKAVRNWMHSFGRDGPVARAT